jgi:hypothetical protein
MPTRSLVASVDDVVPAEYSGKWVAWNSDHSQIVASADRLSELWQQVHDQRIDDPVYEKVPRSDVRFVGAR